jgi:hypothetical protein
MPASIEAADTMIDPHDCVFFVPPNLKKFKLDLFERIARHIRDLGGSVVRHDYEKLKSLAGSKIPIVGCSPPFARAIEQWRKERTPWIYWDRGYLRRMWSKGLPPADHTMPGGYYRWHVGEFQMSAIRDVPDDRWRALRLDASVRSWRTNGDAIVIADTLADYWNVRGLSERWSYDVAAHLRTITRRPIFVRDKESKVPLNHELDHAPAHALVTHGSIAAVEAAIIGFPVFVDATSAAALIGQTDLGAIENPLRPPREQWLHSLAYSQFTEKELCDGTLWKLLQ